MECQRDPVTGENAVLFTAHHREQNSVEGFFMSPNKLAMFP